MDIKGLTPTRNLAIKNSGRGKGSFPPWVQIRKAAQGNPRGSSSEQSLEDTELSGI